MCCAAHERVSDPDDPVSYIQIASQAQFTSLNRCVQNLPIGKSCIVTLPMSFTHLKCGHQVNAIDSKGGTALLRAAGKGDAGQVQAGPTAIGRLLGVKRPGAHAIKPGP